MKSSEKFWRGLPSLSLFYHAICYFMSVLNRVYRPFPSVKALRLGVSVAKILILGFRTMDYLLLAINRKSVFICVHPWLNSVFPLLITCHSPLVTLIGVAANFKLPISMLNWPPLFDIRSIARKAR